MSTTLLQVQEDSLINDMRRPTDFKSFSFSKYKKSEVKNQILNCIHKNKIESALYWCAELVCSGHFYDIWEICFHYFGKYIHLANPKLIVYLERRYQTFVHILDAKPCVLDIDIRNLVNTRKLFAEIICVLALSEKKTSIEPIKISRQDEYDMERITNNLKADDATFATAYFRSKDPHELFIASNELSYHLSLQKQNMHQACYWIEWILDFDFMCRKQKDPTCCHSRNYQVESRYRTAPVWIIWDAIRHECSLRDSTLIETMIESCIDIYCIHYTNTSCKKKRYLLYFAVSLLTEPVNTQIEMIAPQNKPLVETIISRVNIVYTQIKKNENSPNMNYLFSGIKSEYSNSLQKMEMMNQFMNPDFGDGDDFDS